jgi:hypothetical protein
MNSPPHKRIPRSPRPKNPLIQSPRHSDDNKRHRIRDMRYKRADPAGRPRHRCQSDEAQLGAEVDGEEAFLENEELAHGEGAEADFGVDEGLGRQLGALCDGMRGRDTW